MKKWEVKGIILLAGETKGLFKKKQEAVIAYKDFQGEIQVETTILPNYRRAACPGDSIIIYLNSDKLKFGKLFMYEYSVKNQHLYVTNNDVGSSKVLFDNGVLTIGHFDSENSLMNMDFYTYKENQNSMIHVFPIGFSNEIAFEFLGDFQSDTLLVKEFNGLFIKTDKMVRFN